MIFIHSSFIKGSKNLHFFGLKTLSHYLVITTKIYFFYIFRHSRFISIFHILNANSKSPLLCRIWCRNLSKLVKSLPYCQGMNSNIKKRLVCKLGKAFNRAQDLCLGGKWHCRYPRIGCITSAKPFDRKS